MSLLQAWWERRSMSYSTLANPSEALFEALGASRTASGKRVTPESAMRVSAVYACVRRLAETEATIPLITYRRNASGGKERALKHPVYALLHDQPNEWQTSAEFREMLTGHVVLRGNAYARVEWSNGGVPTALIPMHPERVEVLLTPDGMPAYRYTDRDGQPTTYLADEVLHLRGLSSDGYLGLSPVTMAQEGIGVALASEEFAGRFFRNDARPGGILKTAGRLSKEAYDRLRTAWQSRHEGSENAHKVAILEDGMDYTTIGMALKDAQFLETRNYQVNDIARIFGVPPWMIGGSVDGSMTYSNTEQQSIAFVTYSLRPWLVRWEQALSRVLFLPGERDTMMVEHLVDGLLRGDAVTRSSALNIQRRGGALTANEWREIENRNPIEGGDQLAAPSSAGAPAPQPADNADTQQRAQEALRVAASLILRDAFRRCEERRARPGGEKGQVDYMTRALEPAFTAYATARAGLLQTELPTAAVLRAALGASITRALGEWQAGALDFDGTVTALLAVADSWTTDTGARKAA